MKTSKQILNRSFKRMMMGLMIAGMISAGCAGTKTTSSGFIDDYGQLTPDPMDRENAMFWVDKAANLKNYKKFIIEPISFHFSPELQETAKNVDSRVLNDISSYFKRAIARSLSPEYEIVNKAGHDVARLRIALTAINVDKKALKAYQYIPVALVLTGVSEVTGVRDRLAVLGMEGEALDSISGKRIAAVVQKKASEVSVKDEQDLRAKDVYPTLDFWAKKMKARILSFH